MLFSLRILSRPATNKKQKFAWTAENDRALLVLCFGRNPTTEDYTKFVDALPGSCSLLLPFRCHAHAYLLLCHNLAAPSVPPSIRRRANRKLGNLSSRHL